MHARNSARLLLVTAFLTVVACGREARDAPRTNLLVFVIDTLRADRMGAYGNQRNTTPNLDLFARESIVLERAFSPAPHTAPALASLFTSTYPATHGVWNKVPLGSGQKFFPRLSEEAVTLAEVLAARGYVTAAFADGGWVTGTRGFRQGFDLFDSRTLGVVDRVSRAVAWLKSQHQRPFFLLLHTYEVHTPYMPPPGYEDRFVPAYTGPLRDALRDARAAAARETMDNPLTDLQKRFFAPLLGSADASDVEFLLGLYDAELALVDEQFAVLLSYLETSGLLDRTLLIVTADHGEEFREHGAFGHQQVY